MFVQTSKLLAWLFIVAPCTHKACQVLAVGNHLFTAHLGNTVSLLCTPKDPPASVWWKASPTLGVIARGYTLHFEQVYQANSSKFYCFGRKDSCTQIVEYQLSVVYNWGMHTRGLELFELLVAHLNMIYLKSWTWRNIPNDTLRSKLIQAWL